MSRKNKNKRIHNMGGSTSNPYPDPNDPAHQLYNMMMQQQQQLNTRAQSVHITGGHGGSGARGGGGGGRSPTNQMNGMYVSTGGNFMSGSSNYGVPNNHPFNGGERVVLMKCGVNNDKTNLEANPIWGKGDEYIAGTILGYDSYSIEVAWDNGQRNRYDYSEGARLELLENAKRPEKKFTLDTTKLDALVIDPAVKIEIIALLQQHKHAKKIFDEWGLGETIEYGKGMTLMFYGPPGTGKTWGATCIAKALGKELLVLGAAEIQTSEPGGANRNIQNAFAEARKSHKVLFIDECDSLIANRANLGMILASEINTLLTEIERTEEVVILATNMIANMDPALERRLSLIIQFPMPNFEQRVAIWKKLIPKKMPLNKDVDVDLLAKKEISGGLIKNIVLQSARLAVSDEAKEVAMDHFIRAMERVTKSQNLMGKQRVQYGNEVTQEAGVGISKVKGFLDNYKKDEGQ